MSIHHSEVQQRLRFIDRTICHAAQACLSDVSVPEELKTVVWELGQRAREAHEALDDDDPATIRKNVDDLARLSQRAQSAIRPQDGFSYDVKSAVILAHLEVNALRCQIE